MSHSIYSADRMTHLKIVVVALTVGVIVVSVGTLVHLSARDGDARIAGLIKADSYDGLQLEHKPPLIIIKEVLGAGTDYSNFPLLSSGTN